MSNIERRSTRRVFLYNCLDTATRIGGTLVLGGVAINSGKDRLAVEQRKTSAIEANFPVRYSSKDVASANESAKQEREIIARARQAGTPTAAIHLTDAGTTGFQILQYQEDRYTFIENLNRAYEPQLSRDTLGIVGGFYGALTLAASLYVKQVRSRIPHRPKPITS